MHFDVIARVLAFRKAFHGIAHVHIDLGVGKRRSRRHLVENLFSLRELMRHNVLLWRQLDSWVAATGTICSVSNDYFGTFHKEGTVFQAFAERLPFLRGEHQVATEGHVMDFVAHEDPRVHMFFAKVIFDLGDHHIQ